MLPKNLLEHVLDGEAPACAAADGVEFDLGRVRSDHDRTRGR